MLSGAQQSPDPLAGLAGQRVQDRGYHAGGGVLGVKGIVSCIPQGKG